MSLVLYRLSWLLLLPVALVRLVVRGRREPAYLRHVRERLGCYGQRPGLELIWLHAVSVGETRAAQPLIEGLLAQFPSCQVLITHTTPTGRATPEQLFGGRVLRAHPPYDCLPAVRGFMRHFRPRVGILLETELWPELVHAAAAVGMPLFLVNARLSRSFPTRLRAAGRPHACDAARAVGHHRAKPVRRPSPAGVGRTPRSCVRQFEIRRQHRQSIPKPRHAHFGHG